MFIMTVAFERVPADWRDDVDALLEGLMTCCTRRHAGGACCDKESLVLPMLGHVHASTNPLEVGAAWLDLVGPRLKSRFEPHGPPLSLALLVHRPLAAAWQRHSSERCWGPLARHKR